MDPWVLWLIAAVVLAVGEMLTLSFFLAPFAAGAVAAAIVDGVGGGGALTLAAFLIVSVVSLAMLRPLARAHMRTPPHLRTGTAALIGTGALVRERVHRHGGTVLLEGEVWSARPFHDEDAFDAGTTVSVVEIRGATAVVVAD